MKKNMYITCGITREQNERELASALIEYLRKHLGNFFEVIECPLEDKACFSAWTAPADCDVLVVCLPFAQAQRLELDVLRIPDDKEPIPVLALCAHMPTEKPSYSNVCIGVKNDYYRYQNWFHQDFDDGLSWIIDFLNQHGFKIAHN